MTELSDEERALLEAETSEQPEAEAAPEVEPEVEAAPEPTPEEPKRRPRKPRADSTPVEDSAPSEEPVLEHRVIPAQWDGDPWGDTPAQSRF